MTVISTEGFEGRVRAAVIVARFSRTGVPLAQLRLAKALKRRGFNVDYVVGFVPTDEEVPLPDGVNLLTLESRRSVGMLPKLIRYLGREEPDIVFSAEDHLNSVVLLSALISGCRSKISCSSRIAPIDAYSKKHGFKSVILKRVYKMLLRRADVLTCVSREMAQQYNRMFAVDRFVGVYNVVDTPEARSRMGEKVECSYIETGEQPICIAAGLLAERKGFKDLINAMAIVKKGTSAKLVILGDGPQRAELEELISRLKLTDTVRLLGEVDNPLKYFAKSDVFVLSSLAEGMPNVMIEAMLAGCTPVATDCPTGPKEILENGRYGYLVEMEDPLSLANGILQAIENRISENDLMAAILPFKEESVIEMHFELLKISHSDGC